MSRAGEELGLYYARTYDLEVKIVRCPYLYAPQRNGVTAYFNGLFEQAQAGELRFHERAEQRTCFLCADDLAELIYRIFDDWTADSELFHVPNVFDFTYGDLGTLIAGYFPGTRSYTARTVRRHTPPTTTNCDCGTAFRHDTRFARIFRTSSKAG